MRGDSIPLVTWYVGTKRTFKKPKYRLHSAAEEKMEQDKLGRMLSMYYGTSCEKCCGVYPKFFTEGGFKDDGYYVCLVCGKESTHKPMAWQARDAWNNHKYIFNPETEFTQMTIFDLLEETQEHDKDN